jgi:polyisoprenoid-binding protein YceI
VIVIDPPHPTAAHIDVDIDASSVDTAMAVRDDHLRSEEFSMSSAIRRSPSAPRARWC